MSKPDATVNTTENTPKRKRKALKTILVILSFVLICLAIAYRLNDILRKKWNYTAHAAQQIMHGYYEEKDHTIDVLCLGSSALRNGVSGLEMYHDYGFTTTSVQLPVISYYLLQETLDKHDIKAVVIDGATLTNTLLSGYSKEDIVGKIHEAVDYMPMSTHRTNLIREIVKMDLNVSLTDFLIPLYTYHDRWAELSKDDFTYRQWQEDYFYKGQNPKINTFAHSFDSKYMTEEDEASDAIWINEDSAAWFDKLIQLCREKGIEIAMIKVPSDGWTLQYSRILQDFADSRSVKFIDFNMLDIQEEIGFNPKEDYCDNAGHLNVTGAKKLSEYLGKYLASVCSFEDKREDPAYASWNDDYDKYHSLLMDAELRRETNLITYLQKLNDPDYITIIATRENTSRFFNDEVAAGFAALGIDQPFKDNLYFSYAAILDGGKLVAEAADSDPLDEDSLVSCSAEVDGHTIIVTSQSARAYNDVTFQLDGESVGSNSLGFNFVVYDKKVRQIISEKAFNTGLKGKDYTRPNPFADVTKDPVGYLDLVANEDYITVIGVRGDGARYIPGAVNDKLVEMGLLPLNGAFNRPYLAVLNGSKVVFNQYGDVNSEIAFDQEVAGIPVTAASGTVSDKAFFTSQIENEKTTAVGKGLTIQVFSKSDHAVVSKIRFDWSKNYVTSLPVGTIDSLDVLLTLALKEGDDVCLLYLPNSTNQKLSDEIAATLEENGLDRFDSRQCFAAVLRADGSRQQIAGAEQAALNFKIGHMAMEAFVNADEKRVTVGDAVYTAEKEGLYVLVYNAENRAVLTEKYYEVADVDTTFYGLRNSPIAYLEHAASDDYITVIGVCQDAMKCLPAAVNEQLVKMGLLPLDGADFNRPYLAILDGTKVVYNRYGDYKSEISVSQSVDGVDVTAVSCTIDKQCNFYSQIGGFELKTGNRGLVIHVYSKSRGCAVSSVRFNFMAVNYVTGKNYSKITSLRELIASAKQDGCEVYIAYSPALTPKGLSKDLATILTESGFTKFSKKKAFVGAIDAEGNVQQNVNKSQASLQLERSGVPVVFTAKAKINRIRVNGVRYQSAKPGLFVLIYSPEHSTVLAERLFESN